MASTPLNKLAYRHFSKAKPRRSGPQELSTKLMGWLSPDAVPKTVPVPRTCLDCGWTCPSRSGLARGRTGVCPEQLLFDSPWLEWFSRYPQVWMDLPATRDRRRERNVRDLPQDIDAALTPITTSRIFTIKPMDTSVTTPLVFTTCKLRSCSTAQLMPCDDGCWSVATRLEAFRRSSPRLHEDP